MQAQEGHKGCTSAGADARVNGTVGARVRHVIDRRGGAQSARHLVLVLVSEGKSNSRLLQEAKGECLQYSNRGGGRRIGGKKIIVQDARS